VGPHRDELAINLDGGAAKTQASQGEAWSIALGLKLSVADIYRETSTTGDPVVVLDDVFSVLDAGRRARLMEYSAEYEQVLVTSASPETAPQAEWASVLRVDSGEVSVDG
jgi:DNA replication and repair protein RecF